MDEAQFASWAMKICLSILIIFLGFIVWDLGKKSQAGKFGTAILFLVLGLAARRRRKIELPGPWPIFYS